MAQQTAVDVLMENIFGRDFRLTVSDEVLNAYQVSIEMEKEQIVEAWDNGNTTGRYNFIDQPYPSANKYYNETYGEK